MTLFRPCIDLHDGQVKQIVGGTLSDTGVGRTNFVSAEPPAYFAKLYRADRLSGAHVIKLGPGNDAAAREALAAWPGGMQIGGGITIDTASTWLDAGASHIIVTSWLFPDGRFAPERLHALVARVGRERLVIDLSCRRVDAGWRVAIDRWQRIVEMPVDGATLAELARSCSEFLIHAADVEGLCQGIDAELVGKLAQWSPIPCVYAGGARSMDDVRQIDRLSHGRIDVTIGSALDLFGGQGVAYRELVAWNAARSHSMPA